MKFFLPHTLIGFLLIPLVSATQISGRDGLAQGTGLIAGRVLTASLTPQPLRKVIVTLTMPGAAKVMRTTTSDDGRFEFAQLPVGRFAVAASKPAYMTTAYGALRPGSAGVPIALAEGEHASIELRLPFGAILSGRVISKNGEPVPRVMVLAYRARAGLPFKGVGSTMTDDRGAFRLFGLAAGDYVLGAERPELGTYPNVHQPSLEEIDARLAALAARVTPASPAPRAGPASITSSLGAPVLFAPIYFPNVPSRDDATRISVTAGEERSGLDITFDVIRMTSIEGQVTGVEDPSSVQLSLGSIGNGTTSGQDRPVHVNADRTFIVSGVAPGRYLLRARALVGQQASPTSRTPSISVTTAHAAAARTAGADALYAMTEVDTYGGDVRGVALDLQPGSALRGVIQLDRVGAPLSPAQLAQVRVRVSPLGGSSTILIGNGVSTLREAVVGADGAFLVRGVAPGKYTVQVELPAAGTTARWWPMSAVIGGRDLLDTGLEFRAGEDVTGVALTLSDRHAELTGTLTSASGRPAPDYAVVVFSSDRTSWSALSRRTKIVRPDTDGRFRVPDLPPGEYLLATLTDIDPDELMTPMFFEQLAAAATHLTITPGETKVQNLQIRR